MKSQFSKLFISSGVVAAVLGSAAIGYCSTKWFRHSPAECLVSSGNGGATWECSWTTTADFDAPEVNTVIVDTFQSTANSVSAQLCISLHGSSGESCSASFSSGQTVGSAPITITNATALNLWRNHSADYPFVLVSGLSFQGFKVVN